MSTDPEKPAEIPQFPQYGPPHGIPLIDPRQQKPLNKMIKSLARPMSKRDPFHHRTRARKSKHVRFY